MGSLKRTLRSSCLLWLRWFTRTGLGVVAFLRVRVGSRGCVLWSSGSFLFTRVNLGARSIHSGPRGFSWAGLGVFGFIPFRVGSLWRYQGLSGSFGFAWVHLRAPKCRWVHSGSRGFTLDAHRGQQVYSGSRGFTRASLGAVGFIRDRVGSLWHVMGLSSSLGFAWVNLGAPKGRRVH